MPKTPAFVVKKSFRPGQLSVVVSLKGSGYHGDSVAISGTTELTAADARALAASLIAAADQVDAKEAANAAKEARRQKYQDREIAAGRMVVVRGLR